MTETANNSVGVVQTRTISLPVPAGGWRLHGGGVLPRIDVAYETYGERAPDNSNVVFVCHALTGDAHAAGYHDSEQPENAGWWDNMIGPGKGIDTRFYHVICANILGGCRGTTGPCSENPQTGKPYGSSFPRIAVEDIVDVHIALLRHLGIEKVAAVAGGSFGGMQVLDWAIRHPETAEHCLCIASAASLATQALAFDIVGRQALTGDDNWQSGDYYDSGSFPEKGLALARRIGHITYLSPEMMHRKFGRERRPVVQDATQTEATHTSLFEVESYLDYQGRKFVERFDANSYLQITCAMDEFDLTARYGSLAKAFEPIRARMLIVALSDDWLFPPEQSEALANALLSTGKNVSYCRLEAPHGHDAFLVDVAHLTEVIRAFMPWVHCSGCGTEVSAAGSAPTDEAQVCCVNQAVAPERLAEYRKIAAMVTPGSRVIDLGCGDGGLLSVLESECGISGFGVDIALDHIVTVMDKGHDVFQSDIDHGLSMIPDSAYDVAILSETMQVVHRPRAVLRDMLRVARQGIVSFPNFGRVTNRLHLLLRGRMPVGRALPYQWYETPNIHLFTFRDFCELCRRDEIRILETVALSHDCCGRWLAAAGLRNLGADRIIARVARKN